VGGGLEGGGGREPTTQERRRGGEPPPLQAFPPASVGPKPGEGSARQAMGRARALWQAGGRGALRSPRTTPVAVRCNLLSLPLPSTLSLPGKESASCFALLCFGSSKTAPSRQVQVLVATEWGGIRTGKTAKSVCAALRGNSHVGWYYSPPPSPGAVSCALFAFLLLSLSEGR